ncbi:MAG TPA: cyanamide hydratase [Thermoanaerobaculia bacterium]|nr:cyanamide hydratase [Thermoanaerobaculia bacterium]
MTPTPHHRNRIGTLAWARRNGGRLSAGERFAFARATIARVLRSETGRVLRRFGFAGPKQVALALAEIPLPQTPIAGAAAALCTEHSTPALSNHCHRTYLWGALLAARDGVKYDAELFYVVSLLHDLGLTERFAPQGPVACFALSGAEAAERFARREGWTTLRAEMLAEAICLHLNPNVSVEEGAEAHLVRQGSGLDVVGLRFDEIARGTRAEVLGRHPRIGLSKELAATLDRDAGLHPHTRMAGLCRLGFAGRVRSAPFSE